MKQRLNTSWSPTYWGLFFLLIFIPQLLTAQEDSTRVIRDSTLMMPIGDFETTTINLFPETEYPLNLEAPRQLKSNNLPSYSFKNELHLPYHTDNSPLFRGDFKTEGVLWQSRFGAIYGSGEQETIPGIGRFNEASLGYRQVFNNRFALQMSVNAMKINRLNFVGETLNTSGRLSYRASDQVAFNVFGTYNIGQTYGMNSDSYGASVSVVMSDRFRMEVGAQRYYNTMTGRWETVPIAIPTYRFDNGFELGLDVGNIIYQIFRNVTINNNHRNEGPTIAPPRMHVPMR